MTGHQPLEPLARAVCDSECVLLSADPLIGRLQAQCGGSLPGPLAIAALAELVARVRALRLPGAGLIHADDGEAAITAWAEAVPQVDGRVLIAVHDWRAQPHSDAATAISDARSTEIDTALAGFNARLDASQRIVAATAQTPRLAGLAAAMNDRPGQPWTDFVSLPGSAHRQPLHWRLLDGAEVQIGGAGPLWRARLVPVGPAAAPDGFALTLTALSAELPAPAAVVGAPTGVRIGQEVAPVLRQPIARIIANAETIRNRLAGPLADEYCAYAGDIALAGQHLLDLVEDLADLEAVEAEGFATAADRIDLADVARRACGLLAVRARDAGIALEAPAADDAIQATAEFRRALQILLNLVGNALRYSPRGSTVRVMQGDHASIIVSDDGPGIVEADRERVFAKFERLGRSGDGGTGLGLYISRRLARAMGGDLTVTGAPGEGARFILSLPG